MLAETRAGSGGGGPGANHAVQLARARQADARLTIERTRERLAAFDAAQRKRLMTALDLLRFAPVVARIEGAAKLYEENKKFIEAVCRLDAAWDAVRDVGRFAGEIEIAWEVYDRDNENTRALGRLRDRLPMLHEELRGLRSQLDSDPYPFEHAREGVSIGAWAVEVPTLADNLGACMQAAQDAVSRLRDLYVRLMSRLVVAAEKVESLAKLPPLPAPAEEKKAVQ